MPGRDEKGRRLACLLEVCAQGWPRLLSLVLHAFKLPIIFSIAPLAVHAERLNDEQLEGVVGPRHRSGRAERLLQILSRHLRTDAAGPEPRRDFYEKLPSQA